MAANVGRAQLVLVEALHRMGYHGAATGWLSRVVEAGPEHPGHVEAVRWILALARATGSYAASYLRPYQGALDEVAAATLPLCSGFLTARSRSTDGTSLRELGR